MENGFYTVTPIIENPSYFSIFPTSVDVNFPSDTSPYIQDFCVSVIGASNDLEVVIVPLQQARPGFNIDYRIFYKNNGTTVLSGDVILQYNDDLMDIVFASPFENNQEFGELTWNYSDLQPQEYRSINFLMNINSPVHPDYQVNGGDMLNFTATINPTVADELPEDNMFVFNQIVVNSYDPNDITCLEGDVIAPEKVGDFVHYTIRFENTGSASAVNIVVKDDINPSFFDVSSLIPLTASHDFITRIDNDTVEFIFENINLPFDDASNDGYVSFKIKTLPTLELGDTFTNTAEIYFDYNAPIITNTAITTVEESLFVDDFDIKANIKMYPNPVSDYLFIESNVFIKAINLHDINGRLLQNFVLTNNRFEEKLDISKLNTGVYFVTIVSDKGELIEKLIKN